MIKLKVSYETKEELQMILKKLGSLLHKAKIKKSNEGKYKKLYITLKDGK